VHYGNSSNEWAFVLFSAGELMSSECCFYRLLYMDSSTMRSFCFLKYFGKYPKEPEQKKKMWASWGGLIQEQIKKSSTVESQKIGRGEVVLWNSCLAKTSSLFFPPIPFYFFNEKDIWCRQWRWSIFSHSSVLCQELPFRVNIPSPVSASFSLQPQEGWVSAC